MLGRSTKAIRAQAVAQAAATHPQQAGRRREIAATLAQGVDEALGLVLGHVRVSACASSRQGPPAPAAADIAAPGSPDRSPWPPLTGPPAPADGSIPERSRASDSPTARPQPPYSAVVD